MKTTSEIGVVVVTWPILSWGSQSYLQSSMAKARVVKLCTQVCYISITMTTYPKWACSGSRHVTCLILWGITDEISETVQDKDIVTVEE